MTLLAPSLQAFFTGRLTGQLQASGHTIRSYRATWRLLLLFAAAQTSKAPSGLDFADISAPLITSFLDHLEHQRGNTVRTRNLRLAASPCSQAAQRYQARVSVTGPSTVSMTLSR